MKNPVDLNRLAVPAIGGAIFGGCVARLTSSSTIYIIVWIVLGLIIGSSTELVLNLAYRAFQNDRTQSLRRFLRRYALVCLWLLAIFIYFAAAPDVQRFSQAFFRPEQPYPYQGILVGAIFNGIIVALLYLMIRPWAIRYPLTGLSVGFIVLFALLGANLGVISDPPGFQDAQVLWLSFSSLALLIASILTARALRLQKALPKD